MAWLVFLALVIIFGIVLALSVNMKVKPAEGSFNDQNFINSSIFEFLLNFSLNMTSNGTVM